MAPRHDALSEMREKCRGKLRTSRDEPVTAKNFNKDSVGVFFCFFFQKRQISQSKFSRGSLAGQHQTVPAAPSDTVIYLSPQLLNHSDSAPTQNIFRRCVFPPSTPSSALLSSHLLLAVILPLTLISQASLAISLPLKPY